ncbi:flagellin [Mediterraneibacter glycyrrhizinilyticus]|uniref:flagellin N-terminal helical domain-containing protein n=1 Tax=Mediterraneibacter glycyrrhizinilyticus TaxID=342942 RepID=UPI0036F2CFC9
MRIQHNIAALNSYRNLTGNNNAVAKNLEKLSSGYRINRAGDDAAGLAISEKMRAQITGLNTAQKNAQDGVSLVQTAEGALTEVHSMLNRMVELADQSANGTYDNEVDRANLQKEIASLKDEINRIADSTNFNGINLLDGSLSAAKLDVKSASINGNPITPTVNAATGTTSAFAVKAGVNGTKQTLTVEYADESGTLHEVEVEYTSGNSVAANDTAILGALQKSELASVFDITSDKGGNFTLTSKVGGENGAKLTGISTTDTTASDVVKAGAVTKGKNETVTLTNGAQNIAAGDTIVLNGKTYEFVANTSSKPKTEGATAIVVGVDDDATIANLNTALENAGVKATKAGANLVLSATKDGAALTLQIGDTSEDFNQMNVSVGDMHTAALGIADIDISTQAGAKAAVDKIKSAINSVSSTRGDLGAIQNRLEHTINNLSVTAENMTAAESRIRDVDMANEMMAYTKNNILVQSSQAMLAQANQLPQGVLQLLQ